MAGWPATPHRASAGPETECGRRRRGAARASVRWHGPTVLAGGNLAATAGTATSPNRDGRSGGRRFRRERWGAARDGRQRHHLHGVLLRVLGQFYLASGRARQVLRPVGPGLDEGVGRHTAAELRQGSAYGAVEIPVRVVLLPGWHGRPMAGSGGGRIWPQPEGVQEAVLVLVIPSRFQPQSDLFLALDDGEEGSADGDDEHAVPEGHGLGSKHRLERRHIGDGELRRGDPDDHRPDDPRAARRRPGERGAVNVADEEEVEDLQHHQRVHRHGLRQGSG